MRTCRPPGSPQLKVRSQQGSSVRGETISTLTIDPATGALTLRGREVTISLSAELLNWFRKPKDLTSAGSLKQPDVARNDKSGVNTETEFKLPDGT